MFDESFVNMAKKQMKFVDVVSFDIFDTLLLRPYLSPRDLFLHIEKEYALNGFLVARRSAEQAARRVYPEKEDITFDDIYEKIEEKFKVAKQIELDWELRILLQNPEMKLVWDYAKQQGKKIIVTSDMYLPNQFLKNVLIKNGFDDFENLYVSSDFGKTKKTGALFQHVLSELNIVPEKILHIGDNKKGDFKTPKRLGLNCVLYKQVTEQFLKENKRAPFFLEYQSKNLGNSILLSLLALRWQKEKLGLFPYRYWENIGYGYAAPLAYGYTRWIEGAASLLNLDHLLFVARDGYLLQKVFASFNEEIKHSYIYAPRLLNLTCRLDYDIKNTQQIKAILDFFSEKYPEVKKMKGFKDINYQENGHHFIQDNIKTFEKYAKKEMDLYQSYVSKKISGSNNIAVIDTKTIAFTSQKLLEQIVGTPLTGLYWSTILDEKIKQFKYLEFIPNNLSTFDHKVFSHNWKFIEMLLSSPEYPIKGVNQSGEAVYDMNPSEEELRLKQIFNDIEHGVDSFLQDTKQIFGHANLYFEGSSLINWINAFCELPTRDDIINMSNIYQAVDVAHKEYNPLFSVKITLDEFIKHPVSSLKLIKKAFWKTPTQSLLLSVFKPVKAKYQKKEFIKIALFPHLQHQYLVFWMKLFKNMHLNFIVGRFGKR